jgi:hypothetical protein
MKLEIQNVADKGNLDKERLVLKVRKDTDMGDYVLLQTGYDNGSVNIEIYATYWFPYKEVKTGDLVVIYTKDGVSNEKELTQGYKAHFFYWELEDAIWSG